MADTSFLGWPWFTDAHRALARDVAAWRTQAPAHGEASVDDEARAWVRALGDAGWLRYVVPRAHGGITETLDVRSICLIREALAYESGIGDFAFAMQGLGTGAISLFGSDTQKQQYLPRVATGEAIAAFAITEKDAGSDVSAMTTDARQDGDGWVINGEKAWISNAGIADHYVLFTRMSGVGDRAFGAFVLAADSPGLSVTERVDVIAPHVLGTLSFEQCRVPASALLGKAGDGLKIALGTLDVFRTTVAAAALGFARRALDEAIAFTRERKASGGQVLAQTQLTQAKIAEMALAIDAAALLVYRAAWTKDSGAARITREAAMAKLFATESAQRVIDDAVQLLGARGVVSGAIAERLYREIRALRIYEGTSEIQKLVIAAQVYGK